MITIDARALREQEPTGVTVVAAQMIAHVTANFPDVRLFTGEHSRSSTLTNLSLMTHTTTIERCAGVYNVPSVVFIPNTHFVHTEVDAVQIRVVHDLSFAHSPHWYPLRMRVWHRAARAIDGLKDAAQLIAVSEWSKRDIIAVTGIDQERISVVNPATPTPQGGVRPHSFSFKDAPFFLYLGTLEKRKNVRGVIEAFEMIRGKAPLRDFHLVLAGRAGFDAPRARELTERVHHLAYVTPEEKWWLLKHARALVYPSFCEGFGLPPLEAAAVGCPTIISDCTAVRETMGDASLQVSPYDVTQIALAMEALATDRTLATTLKLRGYERAAWYSAKRQRDMLIPIMQRALSLL